MIRRSPTSLAVITVTVVSTVALALPLAGCGSDTSASPDTAAVTTVADDAATATVASDATDTTDHDAHDVVLIDVRNPDEYAVGHLAGAVNYSVEQGDLEAALADLDPSAHYEVYCHSGRRSAIATNFLVEHGFTDVTDLGGIDAAAAATGLAVVVD